MQMPILYDERYGIGMTRNFPSRFGAGGAGRQAQAVSSTVRGTVKPPVSGCEAEGTAFRHGQETLPDPRCPG